MTLVLGYNFHSQASPGPHRRPFRAGLGIGSGLFFGEVPGS